MSKLILPGDRRPGLGLLLPRDAAPKYVCRTPAGDGAVCGAKFFEGEERKFERHVGLCARRHRDEIEANSPKVKMPIFYDSAQWDEEYEAYMRGVGQRMKAEGRVEQRRNET